MNASTATGCLRPWQLLAGVCFGMACGTKWSGVYVLAVFGVLVVVWEVLARREHAHDRGLKQRWVRTTLAVGVPAFFSIVGVAFIVYIATWTGWLIHHDLYEQRFGLGIGDDKRLGRVRHRPDRRDHSVRRSTRSGRCGTTT